jgi:hypothetical protein
VSRRTTTLLFVLIVVCTGTFAGSQTPAVRRSPVKSYMPSAEASPILQELPRDLVPAALADGSDFRRRWDSWVRLRDRQIRGRLLAGDEETTINFLIFGTSFTTRPRIKQVDLGLHRTQPLAVPNVRERMDDLLRAVLTPRDNERLQWVRKMFEANSIEVAAPEGQRRARAFLERTLSRVVAEGVDYGRMQAEISQMPKALDRFAAVSTMFSDRGLSADTRLNPNFAIDQTLDAIRGVGAPAGWVQRVAIVGPGLDFADKQEGFDFYPLQTIQPFAVIDSLVRLGFASSSTLRVTAFDLSPRVNGHIGAAVSRARAGTPYQLALPLDTGFPWSTKLRNYWSTFGAHIGTEHAGPPEPPEAAGRVMVRYIAVQPAVVERLTAEDVNIVVQRLAPLDERDRFDLIIATNVLLYYDRFEQSLAASNLATMLRSGGLLLSNTLLPQLRALPLRLADVTDVTYADGPGQQERVLWYRRD